MKFTAGLLFAAIAVAGVSAESSKTQTVDPSTLTHVDPSTITGLGPAVPGNNPKVKKGMEDLAGSHDNYLTIDPKTLPTGNPANIIGLGPALRPGMPGYGQNAQFNKAWADYLAKEGKEEGKDGKDGKDGKQTGSGNYYTVDPKTLETQDPAYLQGPGPQQQGRALEESTTTTFHPESNPTTIDPAMLGGLGPQTPAGDNPKLKKAMEQFSHDGSSNYLTIDPKTLPIGNPANIGGLGPAVLPGMPGYGKNEKANKAWKEYLAKEGASQSSSSGSVGSNCAQVCPEVYQPVCGSDDVTYSNSCFLGIASCNNPEKHITKASDDACSTKTTQQS
ncbi:Elastase inhibitor [Phytophthora cinnamomi]|uniref:Elastase inhibitor n=1 Tax=Phytophthora cinnamomi TaxID=4785 RepID=UPI003559BAA9|nr:Elastase inhibitor [Phytophthora cinnamomi]